MAYNQEQVEAIPLIAQDHNQDIRDDYRVKSEHDSDDSLPEIPTGSKGYSLSTLLLAAAFLLSLVSLTWNAVALASVAGSKASPSQRIVVDSLRRPSIYLGMERVPGYKNKKHSKPASGGASMSMSAAPVQATRVPGPGEPTELARVNMRYPDVVFEQDGWVFLTEDVRRPSSPTCS